MKDLLLKIRKGAPLDSQEREDILVEALEEIDKYEGDKKSLGWLQGALHSMRPFGPDLNLVIRQCSQARKAAFLKPRKISNSNET